ncbi:MAG: hypothetical protein WCC06_10610 [Candidatus Aminicenantales bacterium]
METRYRALRTIATIFKVLGWVILILGILSACGASALMVLGGSTMMGMGGVGGGSDQGLIYSLIMAIVVFVFTVVFVGLYALLLIAGSEGIYVFLDIEANTREMARRLGQRGTPAPPPPSAQ